MRKPKDDIVILKQSMTFSRYDVSVASISSPMLGYITPSFLFVRSLRDRIAKTETTPIGCKYL